MLELFDCTNRIPLCKSFNAFLGAWLNEIVAISDSSQTQFGYILAFFITKFVYLQKLIQSLKT